MDLGFLLIVSDRGAARARTIADRSRPASIAPPLAAVALDAIGGLSARSGGPRGAVLPGWGPLVARPDGLRISLGWGPAFILVPSSLRPDVPGSIIFPMDDLAELVQRVERALPADVLRDLRQEGYSLTLGSSAGLSYPVVRVDPALAEEEVAELEAMAAFGPEDTGVSNTIYISPDATGRHAAR